MQFRWLAILACLLITACSNSATEEIAKNKKEPIKPVSPVPIDVGATAEAAAKVETEAAAKVEAKAEAEVEAKAEAKVELKGEPKSPSEQFEAAKNRFDTARSEFMVAYRKAPEADRAKMVAEKYPKAIDYAEGFLSIAAENPKDPAAFDALLWVANNVRSGDPAKRAFEILMADHIENEGLTGLCSTLRYSMPSQAVEDSLNRLIEKSPHDSVKAAATFALASYLNSVESAKKFVLDNPDNKRYDEETLNYIDAYEQQSQVIETMYQTLISDYPDLIASERSKKTYKEIAEAALFEINYLAIGKMAPDIEGMDFDGTQFKLSDYRGKVVVLDFWGDW